MQFAGKSYNLTMTEHAKKQARRKGITQDQIQMTFNFPNLTYASRNHPGQWRVVGNKIVLVGEIVGDDFEVVTVYAHKDVTPLRRDQLDRGAIAKAAAIMRDIARGIEPIPA